MKNTCTLSSLAALMALSSTPLLAQSVQPLLQYTVGTGTSESYLVLDFENGTGTTPDSSYAFGYLYSLPAGGSSPTGLDVLNALAGVSSGLSYTSTVYSFGTAVDSFTYHGQTEGAFQSNNYWNYWLGTDGQNWTSSTVGPSSRMLSNGSYDGWAWTVGNASPTPSTPFAVSAAPEPPQRGMLALMGLGLCGLILTARRRAASPRDFS